MRFFFILFFVLFFGSLSWLIPEIYLSILVLGTGIPHIILGAKNSQRGLSSSFRVYWKKVLVMLLIPLSLILGFKFGALGLVFYFALHHAISETYSHKSFFEKNIFFNFLYCLIVLSSFLIACRGDFAAYDSLILCCYVVFLLSLLLLLFISKKHFYKLESIKGLLVSHPWLVLAPVLCLLTIFKPISWLVLILYHFAFWGMLPLFRNDIFKGNKERLKVFWKDAIIWNGLGLLSIGLIVVLSSQFVDFRLFQMIILLFHIATYWHISISFIISESNPEFINRIFLNKVHWLNFTQRVRIRLVACFKILVY